MQATNKKPTQYAVINNVTGKVATFDELVEKINHLGDAIFIAEAINSPLNADSLLRIHVQNKIAFRNPMQNAYSVYFSLQAK